MRLTFFCKSSFPAFLVLSALLFSCKKNNLTYTFKGNITESLNNSVLEGAAVKLYQVKFSSDAANSNFQFTDETLTDASGNYEIIIDREKATEFKVNITKDGYFKQDIIIGSSDVSTEEDNVVDHLMDAESWVLFDITNVAPDADDQLTLVKYDFREDCSGCGANDYTYLEGEVDTTLKYRTTAGVYASFSYKNEVTGEITFDSVYTTPFDTVSYTISY